MSLRDFRGLECVACGQRRIVGVLYEPTERTRIIRHADGRVCEYAVGRVKWFGTSKVRVVVMEKA